MSDDPAIEARNVSKRFGKVYALEDCSIALPAGRVSGLVGANGAGKTTLMRLFAGMSRPTAGRVSVFGRQPDLDDVGYLRDIGYLAQEVPLYKRWTVEDHLRLGAHANEGWDDALARDRLNELGIPLDRKVEALSGGMRAQVALALALGKRPRCLLLDEPLASLDPLARRSFMSSLASAMAEGDLTVLLSSHLLTDLERLCDHLVLLAGSRSLLCADIDEIIATHKLLTATARDVDAIERDHDVIAVTRTPRQVVLTVRLRGPVHDPAWHVEELSLEDIVLAYLGAHAYQPPDAARPVVKAVS
jgi:ABC-2 type transport system ATP-binding protein